MHTATLVLVGVLYNPLVVSGIPCPCPPECDIQDCDKCIEIKTADNCCVWSCKCPDQMPGYNTSCQAGREGMECPYGTQECCGQVYPEMSVKCEKGFWLGGEKVDTSCSLGKYQAKCARTDGCLCRG